MDELGEVGVKLGEGEVCWEGYRGVHGGWFVDGGMDVRGTGWCIPCCNWRVFGAGGHWSVWSLQMFHGFIVYMPYSIWWVGYRLGKTLFHRHDYGGHDSI